jgi:MFS family permease
MPAPTLRRDEIRTLTLAALGGALEFYDFIIFVFFTATIGQLFFPPDTPDWLRQLQTFGLFAAGYLARPLGGILMAHYGDRDGRKRMFMLSVLLMALPTLAIGLLPTRASGGAAAAAAARRSRADRAVAAAHPAGRRGRRRGAGRMDLRRRARARAAHRLRLRHAYRGPHRRHPARLADRDLGQYALRCR